MTPAVIEVPLDIVVNAPRNPNKLDIYRFDALKAGIATEGFLQPILVRDIGSDGKVEIIDGHHRVESARLAGLTKLPAIIIKCDDKKAAQLSISMNRLRGDLDLGEVSILFDELHVAGVSAEDLAMTGFTPIEVEALLDAAQKSVDEDMPAAFDKAPESPSTSPEAFTLELEFTDKKEMGRAKRKLQKIAGQDMPLGDALLIIMDGE